MFLNSAQATQSWILVVVQLEDNWPQYLRVVSLSSRRLLFIVFSFSMPLSWDAFQLPTGHVLPVGNRTSCLAADVGRFPWFCLLCYSKWVSFVQLKPCGRDSDWVVCTLSSINPKERLTKEVLDVMTRVQYFGWCDFLRCSLVCSSI